MDTPHVPAMETPPHVSSSPTATTPPFAGTSSSVRTPTHGKGPALEDEDEEEEAHADEVWHDDDDEQEEIGLSQLDDAPFTSQWDIQVNITIVT